MEQGRVLVVTGASSGIGAATARLFGRRGWKVVLAARRAQVLEHMAQEIREQGGEALPVPTDVTQWEQVEALAQKTWEVFGRVDVLLNNAGVGRLNWLDAMSPQDIALQIQVNLIGAIWVVRAFLPGMLKQGFGHIIHMDSVAGFIAPPTYSVYAASKFGLRGFADALRREVEPLGLRVSCLYPGGVATEFGKHGLGPLQAHGHSTPGFLTLSPEDVARVVWDTVHRPRRARYLPGLYRMVVWAAQLLPGLTDRVLARVTRQIRLQKAGGECAS